MAADTQDEKLDEFDREINEQRQQIRFLKLAVVKENIFMRGKAIETNGDFD